MSPIYKWAQRSVGGHSFATRSMAIFSSALLLAIGYSIGLALARDTACGQTHRIESILAVQWRRQQASSYVLEFERSLVQHQAEDHSYREQAKSQNRLQLCGNFPVDCTAKAACKQVFVLFNANTGKFQSILISEWNQLAQVVGNGTKFPSAKHKFAHKLVARLNQFGFKQRAPLAFNQATNDFYIVDNAQNLLYRWNILTQKTDKWTTLTNRFSGLFYSPRNNQVVALLWRMDTLFLWQKAESKFVPTKLSVKRLLNCPPTSYFDVRRLASILSLLCIAIVTALMIVLGVTFVDIQKMYSFNFNCLKIESNERTISSSSGTSSYRRS